MRYLIIIILIFAPLCIFSQEKVEIPAIEKVNEFQELLLVQFASDYKLSKIPSKKSALINKLIEHSMNDTKSDTEKYAILLEAKKLSTELANPELTFEVIHKIANDFDVDESLLKTSSLEEMFEYAKYTSQFNKITIASITHLDDLIATNDFSQIDIIMDVLDNFSEKIKDHSLLVEIKKKKEIVSIAIAKERNLQSALRTLQVNPEDSEANRIAGENYCLVKNEWKKGLPLLAKGNDNELRKGAILDISEPMDVLDQVKLGDIWFQLAQTQKDESRTSLLQRADLWYSLAIPKLTGPVLERVKARQRDIEDKTNLRNWKVIKKVAALIPDNGEKKNAIEMDQVQRTKLKKITNPQKPSDALILKNTLNNKDSKLNLEAIQILKSFGHQSYSFLSPMLFNLADSRDQNVSEAALDAITHIVDDYVEHWTSGDLKGWEKGYLRIGYIEVFNRKASGHLWDDPDWASVLPEIGVYVRSDNGKIRQLSSLVAKRRIKLRQEDQNDPVLQAISAHLINDRTNNYSFRGRTGLRQNLDLVIPTQVGDVITIKVMDLDAIADDFIGEMTITVTSDMLRSSKIRTTQFGQVKMLAAKFSKR